MRAGLFDAAADGDPSALIAERRARSTVATLVVRHEDGERHWIAYDAVGRVASLGAIEQRLWESTDEAARRGAEEHGLTMGESVEVEIEGAR